MNICGIVCEYNPFHNGHLFHIEESKRRGADAIICVMSGNFVQRGDFAIMHKLARAEAAVRCGADMVIELPLPWSISSAELFAYGAVSVLARLGVVRSLSFGAETDDVQALTQTAVLLKSEAVSAKISDEYATGISYATARENALRSICPELAEIIKSPNNILGVEYLKAISSLNSKIRPIAVTRSGAAHDSDFPAGNIASASALRELIHSGKDFATFMPSQAFSIYNREHNLGAAPVFSETADKAMMSVLKRFSAKDFKKYNDVSEGLQFRLLEAVSRESSLSSVIAYCKTKRYAHARLRRIFLNAFLGCEGKFSRGRVPYARILAFNDTGRKIIKDAKKHASIPIITKPSAIKKERKKAQDLFALERRADDIYSLFMERPLAQGSTLTCSPIYVPENH